MESGIIMANESNSNTIGYINLHKKLTRKRTAANPHGAFEVFLLPTNIINGNVLV